MVARMLRLSSLRLVEPIVVESLLARRATGKGAASCRRCGVLTSTAVLSADLCNTILLAELLDLGEHSKATLRRNKTRDDFLRHVLGGGAEQVFELDGAELFDDGALLADALVEALLELVKFTFLLVEVLDEATTSLLHLVQAALESLDDTDDGAVHFPAVLRVPHVMSDELLNGAFPGVLQHSFVVHDL